MKIHPTALVDPDATIGKDVEIGPYTVIEGQATVGEGCRIGPQVHIAGAVNLGRNNQVGKGAILGADPQSVEFDPDISSGVEIGNGNTIREYVTIHRSLFEKERTRVGDDNFLMNGVHLGHDVVVGQHNVLANNCLLAGHVVVDDRCFLGGGSVYHQFVRIGSYGMVQGLVAMGQDLPPYTMAVGTNQIGGLNAVGLRRNGFDKEDRAEIKRIFRLVYSEGKNLKQALEEAGTESWNPPAQAFLDFLRAESHRGICLNLHRQRRKDR